MEKSIKALLFFQSHFLILDMKKKKVDLDSCVLQLDKDCREKLSNAGKRFLAELERHINKDVCIVGFEDFENLCDYYKFKSTIPIESDNIYDLLGKEAYMYYKLSESLINFKYGSLLFVKITSGNKDTSLCEKAFIKFMNYKDKSTGIPLIGDFSYITEHSEVLVERLLMFSGHKLNIKMKKCRDRDGWRHETNVDKEGPLQKSIKNILITSDITYYETLNYEFRSFAEETNNYFYIDKFIDTFKLKIQGEKFEKGEFITYNISNIEDKIKKFDGGDFIWVEGCLICQSCPFGILIYSVRKEKEHEETGVRRIYQLYK